MYNCVGVGVAVVVIYRLELACIFCPISLVFAMKKEYNIYFYIHVHIHVCDSLWNIKTKPNIFPLNSYNNF